MRGDNMAGVELRAQKYFAALFSTTPLTYALRGLALATRNAVRTIDKATFRATLCESALLKQHAPLLCRATGITRQS